jgi:hypothetical protein
MSGDGLRPSRREGMHDHAAPLRLRIAGHGSPEVGENQPASPSGSYRPDKVAVRRRGLCTRSL